MFGRTRLVKSLKDKNYYCMKIMNKARIVKLKQLPHVLNEVTILSRLRNLFAIEMRALFQDENSVYMVLEYIPGGELFSHLRRNKVFEVAAYQFYAIEIACALYHLHQLQIVYRDLKPETVLLTKDGHIRLSEFGLAKQLDPTHTQTFTLCGTPEYVAPEVILNQGYGSTVDWWALGVLLHEMIMGFPPFFGKNPFLVYQRILEGRISMDPSLPSSTTSAVRGFLQVNRLSRLGCSSFDTVVRHSFFKGTDWDSAMQQLMVPPFVPSVTSLADTSNYDFYPEELTQEVSSLSQDERRLFDRFDEILDRPKQF